MPVNVDVKSQMSVYQNLKESLKAKGVLMAAVRINTTPSDNSYCLLDNGSEIETFYFERGGKYELRTFTDQASAIAFFEEWVLSDQSIRNGWDGVVR